MVDSDEVFKPADVPAGNPLPGDPAAVSAAPARVQGTPRACDIADKTALMLIDVGVPAGASGVKAFLRRLYADHRIFDSPLGAFGRGLFTAVLRPSAAKNLRRALSAVDGQPPEREALSRLGAALCERLNAMDGLPEFAPFVAFQYASPSIEEVLGEIRGQDFTQVVALWSRPFPSQLCASAREELLRCADLPGTPPITFIDRWLDAAAIAPCLGALISEELAQFPETMRATAHICFALQALPIEGDRDPALDQARSLAQAALDSAGLANAHAVAYLDALEPRAPLAPSFRDLLGDLATARPPLLAVPLNHVVESLSARAELDLSLATEATRRGFRCFARTPALGARPEVLASIEGALMRHLTLANAFRAEASDAARR